MTVGGIVFGIIASVIVVVVAFSIGFYFEDVKIGVAVALVAIACLVGLWYGIHWYYTSTASGLRAVKTQDSEFNNGIERQILVYDIDGDVIEEVRGKFDVEYADERILFDDETGCRHIIYFKSGTVVVNEIKGEG